MSPRLFALAILLTAPAAPRAQQVEIPPAVRAAADKITADQLKKDLDYLASDELKGRNTDSPGYDMAADYIARRLERAGLQPLGDEGTFFQRYVIREIQADAANAYVEIDGKRLKLGDDFVVRSLTGAMSGARQVVYVGHGWNVPGREIDPYAGVDVKGKLIVVHGPRALPKGVNIPQLGRVNVGGSAAFLEAERRGAAGIIFIPQASVTNWEQMRGQNLSRRELEPAVPSAYAAPPIGSVMLSRQATDLLMAGETIAGADLLALGDKQEYPASFQLKKSVTVHIPLASTTDRRPYNVVALLEGSDPALKSEYVTIASHLDGAVGTRTVEGDSIYNSADDNASGSAGNLAIAEQMAAGPRPKRSIVFIWDSGEERGLWGTRYFVSRPPVPLARIVTHINIDMIGANSALDPAPTPRTTGPNEIFLLGPRVLSAEADALLQGVNNAYLKMKLNQENDRPESEYFYPRTDAGPFLERGILAIGFTSGNHSRYHLPSDEIKFLDPKKMETTARTIFVSAWMLADAKERVRIDRSIPPGVLRYPQMP